MRVKGAVFLLLVCLGLGACSPSAPTSQSKSSAATSPSGASSPSASSAPTDGPGLASFVHCAAAVPAGDNLVIGTVVGDPTVVVRDIQDPSNAKNVCTFDSTVLSPQFVSGSEVAYETTDNSIIRAQLGVDHAVQVAAYSAGFGSGQYAISPDGHAITFLDGNKWYLTGPTGARALATLPAVPSRGVNPSEDDTFLSFSPDGQYVALFQTFHVGGTGESAPDQIRRVSDGSLVYQTSGMTMAVWASVPSRLFFRDTNGTSLKRWDPSTGVSSMTNLKWIRPKASPDGRWIAYNFPTPSGVSGIGFYSVQSNSITNTTPPGRSGVRFLTNDLVWYIGEKPCSTCFGGQPQPTGVTYIYSIAGTSEITSRLASVSDAWPRVTAPGL